MKSEKKRKVIFVIPSMAGGGTERVIAILTNQFIKKGIEVVILMTADDQIDYQLDAQTEIVSAGSTSNGSMLVRFQRIFNMRKLFKSNKDAVIVSFGPGTSFYTVIAKLGLHNRLVISERNDPAACKFGKIRNIIYNQGQALVYQTEAAKECFPRKLQIKGQVIPNPIKGDLPMPYTKERKPVIVAVGRLEEQKNYFLLIKAFAKFHESFPEHQLHIFGEGSLRKEITKEIIEKGLQQYIILRGFSKNVADDIKDASAYVLSSDYEGISNALLEAMALGLPVVSTDCPIYGSRMCIQQGVNGLLVPVNDVNALAKALVDIIGNKEKAEMFSNNAAKIREQYLEENIANMWLKEIDINF